MKQMVFALMHRSLILSSATKLLSIGAHAENEILLDLQAIATRKKPGF